ncbi:MAG: NAD(P)H-dependent oxidoreductase subunit E [Acidimicrobiia bacterium]
MSTGPGAAEASPLADRVRAVVAAHRQERGPLLPVLHQLQAEMGYVDAAAIPLVADELNLSRAEVHGVVTFYRDFRSAPAGRASVRVCRGEACQAVGSEGLMAHARSRLGVAVGDTTADGSVTLGQVFCLGNCALGPSVLVDDVVVGRVDDARFDAVVAALPVAPRHSHGRASPPAAGPAVHTGVAATGPAPVAVYVPGDTAARSVGADAVADAVAVACAGAGREVRVVRNGSRGLLWLEPLVEVATPAGRVAYGPVEAADVDGLVAAGFLDGGAHRLGLGRSDELPWLRRQQRVTFARVGVVDPLSADDFVAHGGLAGLRRALAMTPAEVVAEVTASGLRGRGGAGFPTGIKWATVLGAEGSPKFVCGNADEGDSGTFADRMVMEGDPFGLLEGMAIAAHAVGAREGYLYVRSEYPGAVSAMKAAVDVAYARGWLGPRALGPEVGFDVFVRVGAGAYICGEETAMLESLEGRRGVVRAKPPLPALEGLFARPTVVNNVLTLAAVPAILAGGAAAYQALGYERSRGTQVFQLAGDIARGGIVETPFGVTLGELVEGFGGGTASGRPVRAVQVGGPLGSYLPPSQFDLPMDYESFAAASALVGHGGVVVFDDTVDMAAQARFAMEFCAEESCGKCTPCRVGAVRGTEVIDRIVTGDRRAENLVVLEDLCEVMADASLCAMGGLTPLPVRSALRHWPEDFAHPTLSGPGRTIKAGQ